MPEINERFIKLSSRLPVPDSLDLGSDLAIIINNKQYIVNVVSKQELDNQDGTIDVVYSLKFLGE